MNGTAFAVFGESTCNTTESKYTYANVMTLDLMSKLGEDERFLDCTQSDIINLSLVMLYAFIDPKAHDGVSKEALKMFVDDFDNFKDFAMLTMNNCRLFNVNHNKYIDDLIEEKETAQ